MLLKILSASLPLARVRGVEIRLHFSMLFSLPLAYSLFEPRTLREYLLALGWLLGFTACVLLHELGHAFAARVFDVEVKSVVLWLLGGFTQLGGKAKKPLHALAISAAGPLANMLLAFLCVAGYIVVHLLLARSDFFDNIPAFLALQSFGRLLFLLALVNLLLAVFNLLPLYPMDGGGVLHALMEALFGKVKADWIALIVGIPVLLGLIAWGIFARDYLLLGFAAMLALGLGTLHRSFLRKLNEALNYLFKRGGYYYLQKDFDRAIQTLSADIEREPNQAGNYLLRAACLLNLTQTERCKADVERALKLEPENLLALLMRGELFLMEKDSARAMEYFEQALNLNPNFGVAHFDRGSALMEREEYAAALQAFDRAIQLMPQHSLFYLIRSAAHFRLGDLLSARRDQDKALELDERDALVMEDFNLSLYEEFPDWAEDYYGRVIALRPGLAYAYWGRGDSRRANNRHEDALTDYNRAVELSPREPQLYIRRGLCLQALNQPEKAAADFEAAARLAEKSHLKRRAEEALKSLRYSNSQ